MDRLAGTREDRAVDADQVGSLHPLLARDAANEDDEVAVAEALFHVIAVVLDDSGEGRERAVIEFHVDAVERRHDGGNFNQVQHDGPMLAEDFSRREAEQRGITDLTGGSGDGNMDGGGHQKTPSK